MSSPALSLLQYLRITAAALRADGRTDAELLARYAQTHDETAFAALVVRHGPMVTSVCRHILGDTPNVEDAFQCTFMALSHKAGKIEIETLAGWLHQVARQVALNMRKSAGARHRLHEKFQVIVRPEISQTHEIERNETYAILHNELAALTEKLRVPLLLHYLEGKTQVEIAQLVGVTERAVRKRLERGKAVLQERLMRQGVSAGAATLITMLEGTAANAAIAIDLVRRTVGASLAFRAGTLSGATSEVARQVLRSLPYGVGWMMKAGLAMLLCVGGLGAGAYVWRMANLPLPHPSTNGAFAAKVTERISERGDKKEVSQPRLDLYGDSLPPRAVARLGTERFRADFTGYRSYLAFTPDGKALLTAYGKANTPQLWDAISGARWRQFEVPWKHPHYSGGALISPDGRLLAERVWGWDKTTRPGSLSLWETATGKLIRQLEDRKYTPGLCCAFSPASKVLVVKQEDNLVLWDITTGQKLWTQPNPDHGNLAFSSDGKMIASCSNKGILLRDSRTGNILRTLGHPWQVVHVAFSRNNSTLLAGYSKEHALYLWDVATGKKRQTLGAPKRSLSRPVLSPNGKIVAACDTNKGVSLWDTATGKELCWCQHSDYAAWGPLAFSPDGKVLAALHGLMIRYWEVPSGKILDLPQLQGHEDFVRFTAFTPDGLSLISGGRDSTIRFWDPRTSQERFRLSPKDPSRHQLLGRPTMSPNGKIIASMYLDKGDPDPQTRCTIRLWDRETRRELRRLKTDKDNFAYYGDPVFSPDSKILAADCRYETTTAVRLRVYFWDVVTGKQLERKVEGGIQGFSPDGTLVATRTIDDDRCNLWEVATGKKIPMPDPEEGKIGAIAFSPDGKTVAAAVKDFSDDPASNFRQKRNYHSPYTMYLYSVHRSKPLGIRLGRPRLLTYSTLFPVAFSYDGRMLATAGNCSTSGEKDNFIRIWETATGKERVRFEGHQGEVCSLAFSPDGHQLASGSTDTTILLWDITGRLNSQRRLRPVPISLQELKQLWTALAGSDTIQTHRAIWTLVAAGQPTVVFLAKQLRPVPVIAAKALAQLVTDLDSETYAVRQKARQQLESLGEIAEPYLHQAIEKRPSLELRRSLDHLLALIEEQRAKPSGERLRMLRAIEVLEHTGTLEARKLLEALSAGAPGARQTEEAKASLARLTRRAVQP